MSPLVVDPFSLNYILQALSQEPMKGRCYWFLYTVLGTYTVVISQKLGLIRHVEYIFFDSLKKVTAAHIEITSLG
jgi:hypothetical protein